jgi:hypothetical protein
MLLRPRALCRRFSLGIWRGVILVLVVQTARPSWALVLCVVSATTHTEPSREQRGMTPFVAARDIAAEATLPTKHCKMYCKTLMSNLFQYKMVGSS